MCTCIFLGNQFLIIPLSLVGDSAIYPASLNLFGLISLRMPGTLLSEDRNGKLQINIFHTDHFIIFFFL